MLDYEIYENEYYEKDEICLLDLIDLIPFPEDEDLTEPWWEG